VSNTGSAWPRILASLSGYGQWLLANPDPSRVGTVANPGCAMANLLSEQITGLLGSQAYLKPAAPVFVSVVGPSSASTASAAVGDEVILEVTASRPGEPVLDRRGTQITAFAPLPPTALQITLDRGVDRRWRFCTVEAVTDSGAPDDPSVPLL
jgi:hypothetical protein